MTVHVGTSGWQYDHWRGTFYPRRLVRTGWLAFYADRFATVEVNNTFYRLPDPERFEAWAQATPDDFVFTVKASRFLTHVKRLNDPREPVERLLDHARPLGSKLGPVLVQLPPTLRIDAGRLDETLRAFPGGVRVAVEPRHESWFTDEILGLLREHDAALCLADRGSTLVTPDWATTGWGFVRFHAGLATPEPCYGRQALDSRAALVAQRWGTDADVYCYFNNDTHGCALRDARRFALACRRHGLSATRVPAPPDTQVRV
jgi:uncharacterized protein YecE (DUF72 family)